MNELSKAQLQNIAERVRKIAEQAGDMLLTGWKSRPQSATKASPTDLVTEYDTKSDAFIRAELESAFPDIAVVAEESGGTFDKPLAFFVDPIDGTSNFAHGHPFFCVSIGLVQRTSDRDEALAGVVHAPGLQRSWYAAKGYGAFCNETAVKVSAVSGLGHSLLSTGFPYDRATSAANNYAQFVALDAETHGVRRCGAAALELALVGDASYEAYWDIKLKPWDLAAGAAIIECAGGKVTLLDNSPFRVDAGTIVASNGAIHDALAKRLRELTPS